MSEQETKTEKLTPEQTQKAVAAKVKTPSKGKREVEKKATALERLKVEYVKCDDIKANSYNPNRQSEHDFELLLRSIREDGFTQPIVVGKENVIVDGEHRWRAAMTLGYKEIPIVRVDMDAAQARIATIRHNRARGSHDVELEAEVLRDLQKLGALEWAADSLMIGDDELNRLLDDVSAPDAIAAAEYTEAWVPEQGGVSEGEIQVSGSTEQTVTELKGGVASTALSASAVQAQRDREVRMAAAKSDQEKAQIQKETALFRLSCVFSGEEGIIVRGVLGDRPAEKVLELCRTVAANASAKG